MVLPTKAAKKAAYRLLSNRRVTMEHILQPHHEATADRCRDESLILAIQDTTTLNQPALEATTGLAKLVRASRSVRQRVRAEGGEDVCLWEHAASLPALAAVDLTVPASGGPGASRERTARLEIRAAEVAVLPPKRGCGTEPLTMFAVSATGTDVDDGEEPLHWLLLTTERPAEGQPDSMHALTVLDWYRRRWTVQTWFRTLKSGTRSRDRRLDTADGPPRCLAFDAVTACPVADITMLARERPDTPATEACPEEDIRLPLTLLSAQGHREVTTMADGTPPDIRTFVIDLGRLVGAHPRRRQPLPGVKKVWQGLERLNWAIQVRNALGRGAADRRARRAQAGMGSPIQVRAVVSSRSARFTASRSGTPDARSAASCGPNSAGTAARLQPASGSASSVMSRLRTSPPPVRFRMKPPSRSRKTGGCTAAPPSVRLPDKPSRPDACDQPFSVP